MPNLDKMEKAPRRELHVFYVLDTSGSMAGTPIAKLNHAMDETIASLKDQARSNADAQVKVAVLQFNSGSEWLQSMGPEDIEDFVWEDLSAGGLTDMGAALKELDDKLSRKKFLNSMTGAYLPVIIFMTDGYATDDYKKQLMEARKNRWFARATKIGFAIGDSPDVNMISDVVGNCEAVIRTDDLDLFARLIRFASVTASMLCSTSRTSDNPVDGADIVKNALQTEDAPTDTVVSPDEVTYTPEPPAQDDDADEGWGGDWD